MDNPAAPIPSTSPQPAVSSLPVETLTEAGPTESSSHRWFLWLFGGIALLALGAALDIFGVKFFNQSQSQPQLTPTPSPTQFQFPTPIPTTDPTADWKTYSSSVDNYEFKIPTSWLEIEHSSNFEHMRSFKIDENTTFGIDALTNYYPTLSEYLKVFDKQRSSSSTSLQVLSENPATIGRISGAVREEMSLPNRWSIIGYFPKNNLVFSISININDKQDADLNKIKNLHQQILPTFKFLNNTNDGTLEATVIRSPTCPGPVTDPKNCEAPVANETFNITKLSDNKNIQSVHTDQDGKFTVSLISGSYKLQNSTGGINKFGGVGKNIRNSTFTITAGKTTIQRFDVDTGIR